MRDTVAVVGAGVAGCVTAATLALLGRPVVLVDKARLPLPLVRGFKRGSSRCDVGFHYSGGLAEGGFLHLLLDRLGVWRQLEPVALNRDGFDRVIWPESGRSVVVESSLGAFEESLRERFPASTNAVHGYAGALRTLMASAPFLNPAVPPWEAPFTVDAAVSLADVLAEHGAESALVDFLGRYGEALYGLEAHEVSFQMHGLVLGFYFSSAHTLRGGGMALADALTNRLHELGVVFLGGRAAKSITLDGEGRVAGVVLSDGESIAARTVVATSHPASLLGLLDPGRVPAAYSRRIASLENTQPMFVTFVRGAEDSFPDLQNCYLLLPQERGMFGRADLVGVMAGAPCVAGDTPCRAVLHGVSERDLAWLRSAPPEPDYVAWKSALSEAALARVADQFHVARGSLEALEVVTPRGFERWTGAPDGASYGAKRKLGQRMLRPQTPFAGLFLAGQGLLAPGIIGAAASAIVACCHIVEPRLVWRTLFQCV